MLNQYHPRAPLKRIFVQNDPKPYCHFVILSRLLVCLRPPKAALGYKQVDLAGRSLSQNAPEGGSSYQPKAAPWGRELGVNQRPTGAKA